MAKRWYIVHVYSGFEAVVVRSIREHATKEGVSDLIGDIVVPTEEIMDVKQGRKVTSTRKFFPGYVLIFMDMSDKTWHVVCSTPKVRGFLGPKKHPTPIKEEEAARILKQMEEGAERPRSVITYEPGEQVRVCEGPFNSFSGVVEEVDNEKERIRVSVLIFGRATPVELDHTQVEKI